jgi:hypothetical protein
MAKLLRTLFMFSLCVGSTSKICPMVSYGLFETKDDSKDPSRLLILGELHFKEGQAGTPEQTAWLAQNHKAVQSIIQMIGRCGKKVALMIERHENLGEFKASLSTGTELVQSGNSVNLTAFIESAKPLSHLVEIIYADKRQKEDFLVAGCMGLLIDFHSSVITGKQPEMLIKPVIDELIRVSKGIRVTTLGDYYRAIEKNLVFVRSLLGSKHIPANVVEAHLEAIEGAYRYLKILLREYPDDTILEVALFSIFKDCRTAAELAAKLTAWGQKVHQGLNVLVADISFIDQIYKLFDRGIKHSMFVMGDDHASNLIRWFSTAFKCIDSSTIRKKVENNDDREGLTRFTTGLLTAASKFLSYSCSHCGKHDIKLKSCTQCRQAYYCNTECQRNNWATHKEMCKKKD